jgi:hypothetical protein
MEQAVDGRGVGGECSNHHSAVCVGAQGGAGKTTPLCFEFNREHAIRLGDSFLRVRGHLAGRAFPNT